MSQQKFKQVETWRRWWPPRHAGNCLLLSRVLVGVGRDEDCMIVEGPTRDSHQSFTACGSQGSARFQICTPNRWVTANRDISPE